MHTRIQLDPQATVTVRPGAEEGHVAVFITDPRGEGSVVLDMYEAQWLRLTAGR